MSKPKTKPKTSRSEPKVQRIEVVVSSPLLDRNLSDLIMLATEHMQREQERDHGPQQEAARLKIREAELDLERDRMRLQWAEQQLRREEYEDRKDADRQRAARAKENAERVD